MNRWSPRASGARPSVVSAAGSVGSTLLRWSVLALAITALDGSASDAHPAIESEIEVSDQELASSDASAADFLRRAELFRLRGEWRSAESDYARALELDPQLLEVHLGRAELLRATSRSRPALAEVDRYLEKSPDTARARLLRARILAAIGRMGESRREYDRALPRLADAQPDHYLERATVAASLAVEGDGPVDDGAARHAIEEAISGIDEGLARLGVSPALLLRAVELEVARGRVDDAVARLDRLATIVMHPAKALARKAHLLRDAGRPLESLAAATQALNAIETMGPVARARANTRALEERIRLLLVLDHDRSNNGGSP